MRTCHIDTAVLHQAEQWIAGCRTLWEARLDRLGEFLTDAVESRNPEREKDHD